MKKPITLISVYSFSKSKEGEFIKTWNQVAQFMKMQPGFLDTTLHRSIGPNARFQFVTVAHWESPEAWWTAFRKNEAIRSLYRVGGEHIPALYTAEAQY